MESITVGRQQPLTDAQAEKRLRRYVLYIPMRLYPYTALTTSFLVSGVVADRFLKKDAPVYGVPNDLLFQLNELHAALRRQQAAASGGSAGTPS